MESVKEKGRGGEGRKKKRGQQSHKKMPHKDIIQINGGLKSLTVLMCR